MIKFKGRHFPKPVILMAVRWYVAYALSYRDIAELLAERGIKVNYSTINRWVIKYSPQLVAQFNNKRKASGKSWRMDDSVLLQAA